MNNSNHPKLTNEENLRTIRFEESVGSISPYKKGVCFHTFLIINRKFC